MNEEMGPHREEMERENDFVTRNKVIFHIQTDALMKHNIIIASVRVVKAVVEHIYTYIVM